MRITGLRVQIFEPRPNYHQEVPEYVSAPQRQNGVAIIFTDEGIEGIVSSTADTLRQLARLWRGAAEHLEGKDPFDRGRIARVLARRFGWPQRALGILDYGLWDIAGKALGLPIYKLLGATRERVRGYASTVHHSSDERFIETALACKEQGFTAIKLHPYCVADDDIRLCRAVRKAVGDEMVLMLDTLAYPAPYDRADALRVGRVLDDVGFWWFEDPLVKTDLDGLAELTAGCRVVQVRMGDRVEHITEYAAMIRQRCMDIIAGPASFGITDLMKLSHLAEAHGLRFEPHDFGGGTASLHVLLAVQNADYYEQAVPAGCFDSLLYPGVYVDPVRIGGDGHVDAPTKPGLGFEIDRRHADKVTVETL